MTGPVVCPPLLPGPDLRAELIMSGIIPPGGRHNTTAVLPDNTGVTGDIKFCLVLI